MSIISHTFPVSVAREVGVENAVMLSNIYFWVEKNRANDKNYHDGRHWTYNSMKAFEEIFPYWSFHQIRRILANLEKEGLLLTGIYNRNAYDRTKWYTLSDKAISLFQHSTCINENNHLRDCTNGSAETNKPIPYINTDDKPVSNNLISSSNDQNSYSDAFESWWSLYPRKIGKGKAYQVWKKEKLDGRIDELLEKLKLQIEYQYQFTDNKFIPHAATYLNGKRYDDEVEYKGAQNERRITNGNAGRIQDLYESAIDAFSKVDPADFDEPF